MNRSIRILVALTAAAAAVSAAPASAAPALRDSTVIDDMGLPLRGWTVSGRPGLRQIRPRPPSHIGRVYAFKPRALRLSAGGSLQRTLPPRPWSLSLDVRLARGSTLRIDLGGPPLTLAKPSNGALAVASGDIGATLPPRSAGPGGWHHLQIAGFEPAELHVDGTRIPNDIDQSARIRLRTLRGAVELTGLVATGRDDRRALLLHRLAEIHAQTPDRKFPVGTPAGGRLEFEVGRNDGFWAGALWDAYGLTRARLFRDWGESATFHHMSRDRQRNPPEHWQGLRHYEAAASADQRTCPAIRTAHRCRLFRKSTGTVPVAGMLLGNPGNWAIPSLLWPRRCPTCASSDEVEIRVETMMDAAILEWNYTVYENSRRENPNPPHPVAESPNREAALRHAGVVRDLLVRADGSTAEAVRTNRLDGTVLGYESTNGHAPEGTWARGHAGALYGFARMGLRFEKADLVGVSERIARYLAANLPATRVPPHDFAAPGGPSDPDAGALYAAGLLRLAGACDRMPGSCQEGGETWRELARSMLDAFLARLSAHAPMGASPEGDSLYGIDFALEAIENEFAQSAVEQTAG